MAPGSFSGIMALQGTLFPSPLTGDLYGLVVEPRREVRPVDSVIFCQRVEGHPTDGCPVVRWRLVTARTMRMAMNVSVSMVVIMVVIVIL